MDGGWFENEEQYHVVGETDEHGGGCATEDCWRTNTVTMCHNQCAHKGATHYEHESGKYSGEDEFPVPNEFCDKCAKNFKECAAHDGHMICPECCECLIHCTDCKKPICGAYVEGRGKSIHYRCEKCRKGRRRKSTKGE